MSVNVANYIFAMEERQRALRGNNLHAEDGVGVPANSNVKRCLFGERPDPIELQRKYDEVHREDMRQKEKKWGFNFETETPTDNSRFQWERVHSDVPVSYAMPQLGSSQAAPPPSVHPEDSAENSASSSDADLSPSPQEATASGSGSSKQSLITGKLHKSETRTHYTFFSRVTRV